MKVLKSKSEQLADHLRSAVLQGELRDPLPTLRSWSSKLGISTATCQAALDILKREGWIQARPGKGFLLGRKPQQHERHEHPPVVRWLTVGGFSHAKQELLGALSQILAVHHAGLSVEIVDAARIEAIRQAGERTHEALVLVNLSARHQMRFQGFRNVLQIGQPIPGIPLPYLTVDVIPPLRHAVYRLVRRGFTRISFIAPQNSPLEGEFQKICACTPCPIQGDIIAIPGGKRSLDQRRALQRRTIERLAMRICGRHGVVTLVPWIAGLLPIALMRRGLKVPKDVEVAMIGCTPTEADLMPWATQYPHPIERICRTLCHAALHYFEQGAMPKLHAVIPIRMVSAF